MTVRFKTIIAISLTILFLISVIFVFSVLFLRRHTTGQEENQMRVDVSRAFTALSEEIHKIDMFVYDYAAWDDSYAFINNRDEKYIESNLSDEGFLRNRWSYAVYVNTAGTIVCARGYDLEQKKPRPVPKSFLCALAKGSPLVTHTKPDSVKQGILVLNDTILLLSSRPILNTQYKGPIGGTFILARELTPAEIQQLSFRIGLSLALYRLNDTYAAAEIAAARPLCTSANTIAVRLVSPVKLTGYLFINDVYGRPGALLCISSTRYLNQQLRRSELFFFIAFLVAGLLSSAVILFFMEKTVLSRLSDLAGFVSSVRSTDNLSARIEMPGGDELAQLAQSVNGMLTVLENDVSEQKQAEESIRRQFGKLEALRTIDKAVAGTFDRQITLNIVLEQAVGELDVDAADILLYNQESQILEFAASRGFQTSALQHTRLQIGEGHAGRAVYEQTVIILPDLQDDSGAFSRAPLFVHEGFVTYAGAPLYAKGQVVGVLEIFHRSALTIDQEWLEFLQILAGQAAIAINNADLFTNLQRYNIELRAAYDATIEGWSRALDLRDKETEGHTQRVTEMTVRLARAMGMAEHDIMHVRRGALLHDIGKMGIPDNILLKPDKLSDQEWVKMKMHPHYAYEMLSPITYLQKALAIPYSHHEKWDGSGYPRGLKGEQIPFSARIFAIVDVWDALTSDRPYRRGWPEEKTMEHIRSLAGTHFEPRLVEVFERLFGSAGPV
jgi:putative nucleotidyltransferase with HDIG domain